METLHLPELYKEYKKDTSWFVNWLVYVAFSLGYSSDMLPQDASRPKANKGQHRAGLRGKPYNNDRTSSDSKYKVSGMELLLLAHFVVEHRNCPTVPNVVMWVLRRVIKYRQQVHKFFRKFETDHDSDESHALFILNLQHIHKILEKASATPPQMPTSAHSHPSTISKKREKTIVDPEPDDQEEPKTNSEQEEFLRLERLSGSKYDAEVFEGRTEEMMAAISLYADMREAMEVIETCCQCYIRDMYNIVDCAIITDLALKVIQGQEQRFYKDFPGAQDPRIYLMDWYPEFYTSDFQ